VILHGEEKGVTFGEPQDPPEANEKEKKTEAKGKMEEPDFDIKIELMEDDVVFLPLGVNEFRGKKINDKVKFKITIKGNGVDNWYLSIHEGDTVVYKGTSDRPQPTMVGKNETKRFWPEGEYEIEWDGFNMRGVYDSATFQREHLVKITGVAEGKERSTATSFIGSGFKYDWLHSIEVNKYLKQINISITVALYDGGEAGLNDGSDVSSEAIAYYKQQPLKQRTKSFLELKDMALAGIRNFWSRNSGNIGKGVKIGEDVFEVFVYANWDNKKGLTGPKIKFVTNESGGRSRNWELSRKLFYNVGYLYDGNWHQRGPMDIIHKNKGWYFEDDFDAKEDFKMTAAHEIGHELLLTINGHRYSKTHKDTSTYFQTVKKGSSLPQSGEIDLMKYYYDKYYVIARTTLAEMDVLGLISIFKLTVREL
jgi:hypothetical protein